MKERKKTETLMSQTQLYHLLFPSSLPGVPFGSNLFVASSLSLTFAPKS